MAQMANPDYTIERWHTCLVAYLLLILAAVTNIWGRRALEKLSQAMIIFNILSFVVVVVVSPNSLEMVPILVSNVQ